MAGIGKDLLRKVEQCARCRLDSVRSREYREQLTREIRETVENEMRRVQLAKALVARTIGECDAVSVRDRDEGKISYEWQLNTGHGCEQEYIDKADEHCTAPVEVFAIVHLYALLEKSGKQGETIAREREKNCLKKRHVIELLQHVFMPK